MHRTTAALIFPALLLTACSSPDEAALAAADSALQGQQVDGALQPVAVRMVQTGGTAEGACTAGTTAQEVVVRWTNDPASPVKARLSGGHWRCGSDDGWTGVVFPAAGQSTDDCAVTARRAREYQGPCRWGWVASADLPAA